MLRNIRNQITKKRVWLGSQPRIKIGRDRKQPTKNFFKQFTENAGAVALTLGLILSLLSLYDIAFRKPEADRLSAIAQFNQTVNSAAKTRQELIQSAHASDPAVRLAVISMATPRILNDIATARALLPTLDEKDVGIPQLLILISESMTAGDVTSAQDFVKRAVQQTGLNPYMRSEALRYQGKLRFVLGEHTAGRASYLEGLRTLGTGIQVNASRAFALVDLVGMQLATGYCEPINDDLAELAILLMSQGISGEVRGQLSSAVTQQIEQYSGCPRPSAWVTQKK